MLIILEAEKYINQSALSAAGVDITPESAGVISFLEGLYSVFDSLVLSSTKWFYIIVNYHLTFVINATVSLERLASPEKGAARAAGSGRSMCLSVATCLFF